MNKILISNIFGPLSLEILAASRLPGGFSWPFPLFFPLRDFYKGKLSAFTYYLIQRPGRRTLGLFLCMGVDVHGGVHAGMAQQLLNIFRRCPAIDHVACEGVTENMEVEVLDIIECDVGPSANWRHHTRTNKRPIAPQADKGNLRKIFLWFICAGQGINLVVCAVLFLHRGIVVQTVERPVSDAIDGLAFSRLFQDGGQSITEIYSTDLLAFSRPQLHLVPC